MRELVNDRAVHAFLIAEVVWLECVRICALFTQMLTFYHFTSPSAFFNIFVQYHKAILSIKLLSSIFKFQIMDFE